jgi:hypothetical protein
MKNKTSTKTPTKNKKPKAPVRLEIEQLKALAVQTGIHAGAGWAYVCAHISD